MQAASSSGDYDAPADRGLMDLDALADLPPFDEALIPEAMGILGFDMADLPGGAKEVARTHTRRQKTLVCVTHSRVRYVRL